MAQLDDKTLQNLNKRLEEMDRLLATDYQKAMDLGKAFTQGFTTEQIDAFLKKLNTVSRRDAAKLNVALNLVDVNGRPLTLSEVKRRISQIESAINKSQTSTSIRGTRIIGTPAMTNELQRYKDALSIFGMSTSQQFDLIRNGVSRVNRETKGVKSNLENLLPTLRRLASAFGVAFSVQGLVQFGKKLVETRGEFELQQVALRSFLQNKQLADEIWDKTMQTALQSPFTAMQLTKYTKQLAAYRIETDKLFDTTKRLADVSAGLGVDMQRLILAYGQVKAANYLRASEIRQFTEAGVNVLGELSAYLTEVKGQAVTTAQVMDMVQKRMIRFEDVEEIFKRLTNEGGVFYNMQYIQSQTVKGQINKLHDAYDQMLNSIGKSNEGVLKGTVSLMLNIVQNWREWKTILDSIAFPAITVALIRFGKGLFAANAATIATDKSFKFLTRSGAKLNVQLKALGATLKAHPLFLIASIVFTAGAALINHAKAVNAVNKEYDELNGRLLETQHKMSSYEDKIKQNNDTIKDSSKSQKEHNDAQKDNARMLGELKRDYPDVANGMSIANNGIISMTNSMKEYNAQLRLQIQLNERAKASFFNQSLKKDAQQFDESINKQQSNLAEYTTKAERAYKKIENFLASGKKGILSDKELRDAMQKLQKMAAATSVEEYEKAYVEYATTKVNAGRQGLVSLSKALGSGFGFKSISGDRNLQSNREEIKDEIKDDYIYFGRYLREIALLSENWNGQFALSTEEFISKNKDLLQNMLYTVKKDGTKEIGELGFALSEAFMDAASVSMTEQGQQEIIDELINQFKEKYGLDVAFGVRTKSSERLPDKGAEDKVLTLWRNRIKLIEEMNKKYKDLSKSVYGYAKSEQKVRGEYGLAWLAAGMPFEMNEIDFTTDEGVAEALEKFRKLIPQKLFAELEKEISGRKATIELDAQVRIREDFGRQMEEAFGNYELTLDLQKLNLPSDVLEDMFGMESVTLDQIRQKIGDWYESMRKDGYSLISETDYKKVEKYLKKVDDLERKQQRERIKDYAKYLEYEMSERAKISMDYTRKIAEVQAETAFMPEQRERIIKGLQKEMGEKLAQQDWEDFKGTEVYVQMMEDLEKHGTDALVTMRQELEKVRENAENLSPRALKEVVNAIEKIKDIELDRSTPFVNIAEARKEFHEAMRDAGLSSAKELFQQADALEKQRVELSRQRMELEGIVGAQREYYDATKKLDKINEQSWAREYLNAEDTDEAILADYETAIANRKANDEELKNLAIQRASADETGTKVIDEQVQSIQTETNAINIQIERLKEWMRLRGIVYGIDPSLLKNGNAESDLTNVTTQLETTENKQGTVNKAVNAYDRLGKSIKKTIDYVKNLANTVNPLFDNIMDNLDYLGGETNTLTAGWKEFGDTMVSAITDISSAMELIQKVQEEMAKEGLATSLMSGNLVAAAVAVLGVLIKIVSAIGRLHDARLDRSIEKVQERIDALKDAYARLEKQIEKTWGTVEYIQTYEQQMQNIRDQIEAIESQMNAERAKKNTDENAVLQYQRDIQDAYDQLDELEQKSIEVFGGIGEEGYRSAAEGFVEAWKSAFLETGDGLQGLQDHFDEFLQDWFVKQATMRIAGGMLEPVFRQIDAAVDKYGEGGTSAMLSEIERVRDMAAAIFPDLSLALEDLAGMFGVGGEGSLSGLAAGIQGMTEEQANILEAYWNSVRMYTASIDQNVAMIASALGVGGNSPSTNPQLQQLQLIAASVQATHQLLQSTSRSGHPMGGYGFKVFND